MTMTRKKMIAELKAIEEPKLIQESNFQTDNILRIVSSQGGYRLEVDAFPIDGPFEISLDEFDEMAKMDEDGDDVENLLDLSEDQLEMVEAGKFREDLYYRLTVIPIDSPPLRERKSDIPLLVEKFLERFCASKKREIRGVDDEALECLKRYGWPGNVRELENVVERMVILAADEMITTEDLPPQLLNSPAPTSSPAVHEIPDTDFCLSEVVADYERRLIIRALQQTGWVKNRAAKLLKVNRTTLLEKMKRHGVVKPTEN